VTGSLNQRRRDALPRAAVLALLLAASAAGCSSLAPFPAPPLAADPKVKETGLSVAICYNKFETPPDKLLEMAQADCFEGAVAEQVDTDYRLDVCPVLTPGRATFLCKPPPKPK
jgi:hypothetical protein